MRRLSCFLVLVLLGCQSGDVVEQSPAWLTTLPDHADTLFTVGSGTCRAEALLMALADAAQDVESDISSLMQDSVEISKSVASQSFGEARVQVLTQTFSEVTDSMEMEQDKFVARVQLGDSLVLYQIRTYHEDLWTVVAGVADSSHDHLFETSGKDRDLEDLTRELVNDGIRLTWHRDLQQDHVLLAVPMPPNGKDSETEE